MTTTNRDSWRSRAACLAEDPDLFFPNGRIAAERVLEIARQVCLGCQVRAECLDLAMRVGAEYGMWGGTTPEERRRTRRARFPSQRRPEATESVASSL